MFRWILQYQQHCFIYVLPYILWCDGIPRLRHEMACFVSIAATVLSTEYNVVASPTSQGWQIKRCQTCTNIAPSTRSDAGLRRGMKRSSMAHSYATRSAKSPCEYFKAIKYQIGGKMCICSYNSSIVYNNYTSLAGHVNRNPPLCVPFSFSTCVHLKRKQFRFSILFCLFVHLFIYWNCLTVILFL